MTLTHLFFQYKFNWNSNKVLEKIKKHFPPVDNEIAAYYLPDEYKNRIKQIQRIKVYL